MRIGIIGAGYVGLVTGACLAEAGNDVICMDRDKAKIELLNRGTAPIYEPGLEELLVGSLSASFLKFTCSPSEALKDRDVIFIAVGTPPLSDGGADVSNVFEAAQDIAVYANSESVIALKSTSPVGTTDAAGTIASAGHIAYNPEFLREGTAIEDFKHPDRVIVGTEDGRARTVLKSLYAPFLKEGVAFAVMDPRSAELTKYAANAMLAARISFMNQLSELCERTGADIDMVKLGLEGDPRIGKGGLDAGCGYGGSCLPKDVRALVSMGEAVGLGLPLIREIGSANNRQKRAVVRKIERIAGGSLTGKRIALWGLAYKPDTDDVRDSPAFDVCYGLLMRGAAVTVHDPRAMGAFKRDFFLAKSDVGIIYCNDKYDALIGADVLVLLTAWKEYVEADANVASDRMRCKTVFDGRNSLNAEKWKDSGFAVHMVGKGEIS